MEPPSPLAADVSIQNESGIEVDVELIRRAVLEAMKATGGVGAINILLCDDQAIRDLNKRFRSHDEATDVLSFEGVEEHLGDIAVAIPYATRQAEARGAPRDEEIAFLAIHGALHLMGYDDETEPDRLRMVEEMNRVAELVGLTPDHEWHSVLKAANSS